MEQQQKKSPILGIIIALIVIAVVVGALVFGFGLIKGQNVGQSGAAKVAVDKSLSPKEQYVQLEKNYIAATEGKLPVPEENAISRFFFKVENIEVPAEPSLAHIAPLLKKLSLSIDATARNQAITADKVPDTDLRLVLGNTEKKTEVDALLHVRDNIATVEAPKILTEPIVFKNALKEMLGELQKAGGQAAFADPNAVADLKKLFSETSDQILAAVDKVEVKEDQTVSIQDFKAEKLKAYVATIPAEKTPALFQSILEKVKANPFMQQIMAQQKDQDKLQQALDDIKAHPEKYQYDLTRTLYYDGEKILGGTLQIKGKEAGQGGLFTLLQLGQGEQEKTEISFQPDKQYAQKVGAFALEDRKAKTMNLDVMNGPTKVVTLQMKDFSYAGEKELLPKFSEMTMNIMDQSATQPILVKVLSSDDKEGRVFDINVEANGAKAASLKMTYRYDLLQAMPAFKTPEKAMIDPTQDELTKLMNNPTVVQNLMKVLQELDLTSLLALFMGGH